MIFIPCAHSVSMGGGGIYIAISKIDVRFFFISSPISLKFGLLWLQKIEPISQIRPIGLPYKDLA